MVVFQRERPPAATTRDPALAENGEFALLYRKFFVAIYSRSVPVAAPSSASRAPSAGRRELARRR
jgi:hypothetical protein